MVVQAHIAHEGLLQILATVEVMGAQHIGDARVKALHHAIGLRVTRAGQPVLDAQILAQQVELMLARRLAFTVGKSRSVNSLHCQ